ncbi:MAG: kinase [Verrucomicrobia bacterium]|nr:kinase [Verrucomicrobiota bacterium]
MIITRTPFRISFFGGGTDYPAWYRLHGGAVLATTIDKYCYITCRYLPPFFENRHRIVYSRVENCQTIDQIEHPAVREGLRHFGFDRGVEIHHEGDLPARSGMATSSAFMVGLLHALHALRGEIASKPQLAKEAIHLEQEVIRENVGSQDQVSAAYGGLNHICFQTSGDISVHPVPLSPSRLAELNAHLMLFYTGVKRTASDVAASYVAGLESKKRQLRILKDLLEESLTVLCSASSLRAFGELLHEAWLVKRSFSQVVSNRHVEAIYDHAQRAGALGGKLLGAGGGGFMLLFVEPDAQPRVRDALKELIQVPFEFESAGSQIIFYQPERGYDLEAQRRAAQPVREFCELATLEPATVDAADPAPVPCPT